MKITIVIPVYNDWESFAILVQSIDAEAKALGAPVDIVAVDDGSTVPFEQQKLASALKYINEISILQLACNLGHQRAIAIGLAHTHNMGSHDAVIVMDGDGEDRPEDIRTLVEHHALAPNSIIVGRRARRSEGAVFTLFYSFYKGFFRILTGRTVNFGNFCLIPAAGLAKLVYMHELWNHLAATVLRSRVSITQVPSHRGKRYAGRSSMNFVSLTVHGLSAISVFADMMFVRLLVASSVLMGISGLCAMVAIALRLMTELAFPNWATTVVGMASLVVVQALTLLATASFLVLSNRANLAFVPALNGLVFIRNVVKLKTNDK